MANSVRVPNLGAHQKSDALGSQQKDKVDPKRSFQQFKYIIILIKRWLIWIFVFLQLSINKLTKL